MVFGFLNERLIFYDLFCEGPSALRKYALTAVRELMFVAIIRKLYANAPINIDLSLSHTK